MEVEREVYNVMKFLICAIAFFFSTELFAQYGYVKLEKDSVIKGYIRNFRTINDAQEGLEVWKTKTNENPAKILKKSIVEYSTGKDTVMVIHDLTPFNDEDLYFDCIDAHYVLKGKINLLKVRNYRARALGPGGTVMTPNGLMPVMRMRNLDEPNNIYFIESKDGTLNAMKWGKALHQSLLSVFPETFLVRYEDKFGKITYNKLPKFIKFVNSIR
jgi:hypothetical protein